MGFSATSMLTLSFYNDDLIGTAPLTADNVWYMLHFTYGKLNTNGASGNTHMRAIMRNGVAEAGPLMSGNKYQPNTNVYYLGTGVATGHVSFKGDIDEVRIIRTYMLVTTAAARYAGDLTQPLPVLAWFNFNEQSGSNTMDSSGTHQTLSGGIIWRRPDESPLCLRSCLSNQLTDGYASFKSGSVKITPNIDFNNSPFSVEMWLRRGPNDESVADGIYFSSGTPGVSLVRSTAAAHARAIATTHAKRSASIGSLAAC